MPCFRTNLLNVQIHVVSAMMHYANLAAHNKPYAKRWTTTDHECETIDTKTVTFQRDTKYDACVETVFDSVSDYSCNYYMKGIQTLQLSLEIPRNCWFVPVTAAED